MIPLTAVKDIDKFLAFIAGAIIGSFLNVCIYRLPRKQSIFFPPSHCPNCKKRIPWYDNIPILSYILLMGRCGSCRRRIDPRYLLVEVLTAALVLFLYMIFGIQERFFVYSTLVSALIVAAFIDMKTGEIPDEITLGGLAVGLGIAFALPTLFDTVSRMSALKSSALGAVTGAGLTLVMGIIGKLIFKKDAMGGGDVKLMAFVGSVLGWKLTALAFFIAPFFGALAGLPLRITKGRETIPYGPYLSVGAFISMVYGNDFLRFLFSGM